MTQISAATTSEQRREQDQARPPARGDVDQPLGEPSPAQRPDGAGRLTGRSRRCGPGGRCRARRRGRVVGTQWTRTSAPPRPADLGPEPSRGPPGEGDDDVGGPGAVDQLGQAVEPAEDRHRVGPGVDDQLPAAARVRRRSRRPAGRPRGPGRGSGPAVGLASARPTISSRPAASGPARSRSRSRSAPGVASWDVHRSIGVGGRGRRSVPGPTPGSAPSAGPIGRGGRPAAIPGDVGLHRIPLKLYHRPVRRLYSSDSGRTRRSRPRGRPHVCLSAGSTEPMPARRRTRPLSVVIVNYNGWPDVAPAGRGAGRRARGRRRPRPRSSSSTTPRTARARRLAPARAAAGVRLVARPENGGFAAGVNAGWRAARGRWLLLLNPDVVAGPGLLGGSWSGSDGSRRPARRRGRRLRPAQPRRHAAALGRGRPSLARAACGAVDTALPPEIPGRLARPARAGPLGHRRLHARRRRTARRPGRDGRGLLPVL